MILYLDASALVKVYVLEPGTELVIDLYEQAEMVSTSKVTYVEVLMALRRKRWANEMSDEALAAKMEALDSQWQTVRIVDLSDEVLRRIREHGGGMGLRALDAVHLASALLLQSRLKERLQFICADRRLNEAATAEGLTVLDPASTE